MVEISNLRSGEFMSLYLLLLNTSFLKIDMRSNWDCWSFLLRSSSSSLVQEHELLQSVVNWFLELRTSVLCDDQVEDKPRSRDYTSTNQQITFYLMVRIYVLVWGKKYWKTFFFIKTKKFKLIRDSQKFKTIGLNDQKSLITPR